MFKCVQIMCAKYHELRCMFYKSLTYLLIYLLTVHESLSFDRVSLSASAHLVMNS